MLNILFVCTGNTCRSPMAEGIFNHLVGEKHLEKQMRASSAGIQALPSFPATEMSVLICGNEGIDISSHKSRQLTQDLVDSADCILTMTGDHKRQIRENFYRAERKVFTLKEFVGETGDIEDPHSLGEEVYRQTYREIKDAVKRVFLKVSEDESCYRK